MSHVKCVILYQMNLSWCCEILELLIRSASQQPVKNVYIVYFVLIMHNIASLFNFSFILDWVYIEVSVGLLVYINWYFVSLPGCNAKIY